MTEIVDVDGLKVLVERPARARGPAVLLVHGMFAGASIFAEWLPFFSARGIPAYSLSLRGHEGSRAGIDLGSVSIDDYADDVCSVARWIGSPAIVGHSMGGLIAQKVAERGEARAAVLVCPAPPRGITVLTPRLLLKQAKYMPAIVRRKPIVPNREDLRELTMNHVPPEEQEALLDMLGPDSGHAGFQMSIAGVPVDPRRVRCPLLVIAAGDDRFIPARIVHRIAARYRAQVQTIPDHGHMLIVEPEWTVLADVITRWLADTTA